jgi:hypothetical protein
MADQNFLIPSIIIVSDYFYGLHICPFLSLTILCIRIAPTKSPAMTETHGVEFYNHWRLRKNILLKALLELKSNMLPQGSPDIASTIGKPHSGSYSISNYFSRMLFFNIWVLLKLYI